jgi:thymidylate kinase
MIINIRGTNGSGKSTIARDFLGDAIVELAPYQTPKGARKNVMGYHNRGLDLIVVGPYRTACGGCDAIKTQDLVKESVRIAAKKAQHVLFEGFIVSGIYSGYRALSQELGGITWAYLDTPIEVCFARIQERNGGKSIKEYKVVEKNKEIESTRLKAKRDGEKVVTIPYESAIEAVRGMLSA